MKHILFLFLAFLAIPLWGQTIDADRVRAKSEFSIGVSPNRKTVTSITETVNASSTDAQLPTAAAVYDATVWNWITPVITIGQISFTTTTTPPSEISKIRVLRNGLEYRVGLPGCSNCQVTYNSSTGVFQFSRALAGSENVQVQTQQ